MRQKITKWIQKPEIVFVTLVSLFGILSILLVPQLTANDENMHFLRSYNLADGNIGTENCSYPSAVTDKVIGVYNGNFNADYGQKFDDSTEKPATCGSAASYSPLMHLPQAIGVFFGKLLYPSTGVMVALGRLFNLIFYVIALYYIIRLSRIGKWPIVVIASFPLMIHTAASLSADVMNNVAVIALIAFIFNLFTQSKKFSRKQLIMLLCLAALVSLTKLTNVLLLVPLVLLPKDLFEKNRLPNIPFNIKKWGLLLLAAGTSLMFIIGWQQLNNAAIISSPSNNPLTQNPLHFLNILSNTYVNPFIGYNDIVLRGVIGEFASFKYHLPTSLLILCFSLLLFILLHKDNGEERLRNKLSWLFGVSNVGVLLLTIVVVTYVLYVSWAIQPYRLGPGALYADGVQGRYFTPLLLLLVPIFIKLRKFISFNTSSDKVLGSVVFSVSGFSLLFYIVSTYKFFS